MSDAATVVTSQRADGEARQPNPDDTWQKLIRQLEDCFADEHQHQHQHQQQHHHHPPFYAPISPFHLSVAVPPFLQKAPWIIPLRPHFTAAARPAGTCFHLPASPSIRLSLSLPPFLQKAPWIIPLRPHFTAAARRGDPFLSFPAAVLPAFAKKVTAACASIDHACDNNPTAAVALVLAAVARNPEKQQQQCSHELPRTLSVTVRRDEYILDRIAEVLVASWSGGERSSGSAEKDGSSSGHTASNGSSGGSGSREGERRETSRDKRQVVVGADAGSLVISKLLHKHHPHMRLFSLLPASFLLPHNIPPPPTQPLKSTASAAETAEAIAAPAPAPAAAPPPPPPSPSATNTTSTTDRVPVNSTNPCQLAANRTTTCQLAVNSMASWLAGCEVRGPAVVAVVEASWSDTRRGEMEEEGVTAWDVYSRRGEMEEEGVMAWEDVYSPCHALCRTPCSTSPSQPLTAPPRPLPTVPRQALRAIQREYEEGWGRVVDPWGVWWGEGEGGEGEQMDITTGDGNGADGEEMEEKEREEEKRAEEKREEENREEEGDEDGTMARKRLKEVGDSSPTGATTSAAAMLGNNDAVTALASSPGPSPSSTTPAALGCLVSIAYTVSLQTNELQCAEQQHEAGKSPHHPSKEVCSEGKEEVCLESRECFEFEFGRGCVDERIEAVIGCLLPGQTADVSIPIRGHLLPFPALEAIQPVAVPGASILHWRITLLSVAAAEEEDRIDAAIFSPSLSKQRLAFAAALISKHAPAFLLDVGCGSASLFDYLLSASAAASKGGSKVGSAACNSISGSNADSFCLPASMAGFDISHKELERAGRSLTRTITSLQAATQASPESATTSAQEQPAPEATCTAEAQVQPSPGAASAHAQVQPAPEATCTAEAQVQPSPEAASAQAQVQPAPETTCTPAERGASARVALYAGSLADVDDRMKNADVATCLEVVEHLDEEPLAAFGAVVLGTLRPRVLLVSTPNIEYNPAIRAATPSGGGAFRRGAIGSLWSRGAGGSQTTPSAQAAGQAGGGGKKRRKKKKGQQAGQQAGQTGQQAQEQQQQQQELRNSDHRFEWTRKEFESWANALAQEYGYHVTFGGVGVLPEAEHLGFATQTAVFVRVGCEMKDLGLEEVERMEIDSTKLIADLDGEKKPYELMRDLMKLNPDVMSLGQGVVYWLPPDAVLAAAQAAVHDPVSSGYGVDDGTMELRAALVEKVKTENGLMDSSIMYPPPILPSYIPTRYQAFVNVVLTLCDPDDAVVLFKPFYFNHQMAFQMTGITDIVYGPCDPDTLHPSADWLEEALSGKEGRKVPKVVVITNPNNPTGTYVPEDLLRRISAICAKAGSWLVLDNTYEYFMYGGNRHVCLEAPHILNIFSFSKAYGMMGWRVGYIAYPNSSPRLGPSLIKAQDTIPICANLIGQQAALAALQSPSAGKPFVDRCIQTLSTNLEQARDALAVLTGPGVGGRVWGGEGAIYLWAKLPEGCEDDGAVVRWLVSEHGVVVIPGSASGAPGHIRVSFANLPAEKDKVAAGRLKKGLQELVEKGMKFPFCCCESVIRCLESHPSLHIPPAAAAAYAAAAAAAAAASTAAVIDVADFALLLLHQPPST
ncbi:unnamed protein product [Closterium sp. Naga37s-1]|nr:unnamed protein product [Closterium sp. Naga37s-1]